MSLRQLSRLDQIIAELERSLGAVFEPEPVATRASPAHEIARSTLDDADRRHSAGLMRVNHVGEVCAQALYFGQAFVPRCLDTRTPAGSRLGRNRPPCLVRATPA